MDTSNVTAVWVLVSNGENGAYPGGVYTTRERAIDAAVEEIATTYDGAAAEAARPIFEAETASDLLAEWNSDGGETTVALTKLPLQ